MPEALHDGDFAPPDAAGHAERFLRGAGIVVFAGQQKQRAAAGVDLRDTASDVAVELVEIQIAFEDARTTLHVVPQRLPARRIGRIGPDQSGNDGGTDFAAVDVGTVQEIQVVIWIDMGASLQADDGAEALGMFERQMQRDASTDRASDQDRPGEFERGHDLEDHRRVLRRGKLIFLVVPARRRRRLAVPGHVEGDDAVAARDARIVHQRAVLTAVGAGGVQAEQGRALARLLDIDAMWAPEQFKMHVAADDRLESRAHALAPSTRNLASTSLKYRRLAMKT